MIDLHSHLMPGVDDGAADDDQVRTALETFAAAGVTAAATTPHVRGSLTTDPAAMARRLEELDAAWTRLRELARTVAPDLTLTRGAEVMLDTPAPDLSDPRLRLGGTRFALVELPHMSVPPRSAEVLRNLRDRGLFKGGVGGYSGFTHIDTRGVNTNW